MTRVKLNPARDGFSVIELMVAVVLLAVGLLSMAGMSSYAMTRIRMAKVDTRRATAVASTIEQLRAKMGDVGGYDTVSSVASGSALKVQGYKVWYTIASLAPDYDRKQITLYTEGTSYRGGWKNTVRDTFVTLVARPVR